MQADYNAAHGITPESVKKSIGTLEYQVAEADYVTIGVAAEAEEGYARPTDVEVTIKKLEEEMKTAAKLLEFERAAQLRDRIRALKLKELEVST